MYRPEVVMLLLKIDRTNKIPAFKQICDRIVTLVDEGVLRPGDRLPPTRVLGATIGVHRTTVVRAYDELRALGYIESRAGSYSTIRRRHRSPGILAAEVARKKDSMIDWDAVTRPSIRAPQTHASMETNKETTGEVIDFDRLSADPALAPCDHLRRCIKNVLVRIGGAAVDYADAVGWKPLREVIAARMCNHGVVVSSDEILITAGAQHALDLLLRYLTFPGDRVVVEAPTYGMAHALLKLHEVEPLEVPLLDDGMDLDRLKRVLQRVRRRPKFIFTMPNFQNPTGITTDQQHRERLLNLCEEHHIPLVEDGFEEEMKYFGQAVLPVKSMDSEGIVIYVGTFSKVVFSGLRIGWIAAPREAIMRLKNIKHASCIAGNTLAEAAAARFCASGEFEAYLRRVHRIYRGRMQALLQGLDRHVPSGVKWTKPSGGYTAWVTLNDVGIAEDELVERITREGVNVGPGRRYFARRPVTNHFRLSIACVDEKRIETGCRRLGRALKGALSSAK
jgi:DNA-binding transcriptional MocR family regulator